MDPGHAAPGARTPCVLHGVEFVIESPRPTARRTVRRGLRREDGAGGERSRRGLQLLDVLRHFRGELFSVDAVPRRFWTADHPRYCQADVSCLRAVAPAWPRASARGRAARNGECLGGARAGGRENLPRQSRAAAASDCAGAGAVTTGARAATLARLARTR